MGDAGRQYINANYALEQTLQQWELLFRALLKKKTGLG